MRRIICTAGFLLMGCQAWAGAVDESLKKLDDAMNPPSGGTETYGLYLRRIGFGERFTSLIRERIAANDLAGAIQILQDLEKSPVSGDARKAVNELLASLRKEQETRDRDGSVNAKLEQAVPHASEVIRKAKTSSEIDPVLEELSALREALGSARPSGELQARQKKLEMTYRFAARWQDYLAASDLRDFRRASEILRRIADSDDCLLLVPRSEILAKAEYPMNAGTEAPRTARPTEELANELVAKTKCLEEIGGLLDEIQKLRKQRPWENSTANLDALIKSLEQMEKSYRDYQAGVPADIDLLAGGNPPASVAALRAQLCRLILPRYLEAPADLKPKAEESIEEYLHRVAAEANERAEIGLAIRVRETQNRFNKRGGFVAINDTNSLRMIQTAKNQEDAGQYIQAVVSYQTALKSGSDAIPAKWIGERLEGIKKNHPQDYEKGVEKFLNPPSQPTPTPYPKAFGREELCPLSGVKEISRPPSFLPDLQSSGGLSPTDLQSALRSSSPAEP